MKKIFTLLLTITLIFSLTACKSTGNEAERKPENSGSTNDSSSTIDNNTLSDTTGNPTESTDTTTKILVAYFSATGTTKKVAEYAADIMGADLYEIVPTEPYTSDDLNYNNNDCRANTEMNDASSRPSIKESVANMEEYDIVFIGYPIWWGEAPRIISTFVENYDFSGKTIVTFSTSGGSGHNDRSIKELVSGANWITGTRLNSNSSQSDVAEWINGLDLSEK